MAEADKMMSASDGPDVAAAAASVSAGLPSNDANPNRGDSSEMKQVWRFIYIDLTFAKSLYGIFIAAEMILSLLGLISVSVPKNEGCAYLYSGAYSYYEFTASSCMIVSMIWYGLYLLALPRKLGFIRWDIGEMVWLGFYIFNFLISSCVLAAKVCQQGGYKAAAAFGFFCLIVLIVHQVFDVRAFIEKRKQSADTTASAGDEEEAKY